MFVGLAVVFIMALAAIGVKAETLISYDDGSTYTVGKNEEVYVAPKNTRIFTLQSYAKGDVFFRVRAPHAGRDYVEPVTTTTPDTTGSTGSTGSFTDVDDTGFSQACADFDTDQQATFGYISWNQICDTNNDGEYSICDYYESTGQATFQEIQYNKQCLSSDGS
jgi:hypothetical protein